ncbi:MAG TPA: DUF6263 family protein [Vicinamibacterales bacterium]|nr:DUF6263 family protein [Vicinamibacterales bacterium]
MRMHWKIAAGAVALGLVGAATSSFAQEVTLRYRWTKGEETRTRMTQQASTTISASAIPAGPGNGSVESFMSQGFHTVVEDVAADGTATLRQVIESVRIEFNSPLGKTVFDSASKESDPTSANPLGKTMSAAYSAMIGQSLTMVVSPGGTVQKIEGMARLMERVLNAQPQDRIAPDVLDGFRNTFSDDITRDMLGWGTAPLPDRPLHPGDTWEDHLSATVPLLGATTTSRTWTFEGVETRGGISLARLTAKLAIRADPSAPQPALGVPVAIQTSDSTGESELFFDIARGRVQRVTTALTQPMTMSIPASNGGSMSLQMLIKSTLTLELVEAAGQ